MAVLPATLDLHWSGSAFSGSAKEGSRYVAVWRVETDDALDQSQTVQLWFRGNVIDFDDTYTYGNDASATLALASEISARRVLPSQYLWEIQVDFVEPDAEDQGQRDPQGERSDDPLEWARIASGITEFRRPVTNAKYIFGYGLTFEDRYPQGTPGLMPINSNFQPFTNPPLERDDGREWLMLGGNVTQVNSKEIYSFLWNTNSDSFTWDIRGIFGEAKRGEMRIRKITLKPNEFRGVSFVEVDFILELGAPLEFHPGLPFGDVTWWAELVDKGTVLRACDDDPDGDGTATVYGQDTTFPPATPRMRVPIDDKENIIGEEFLLDGDGQPLDTCAGDTPVAAAWEHYPETSYGDIPVLSEIINRVWA